MSSLDLRPIPIEYWIRAADHLIRNSPSDLLPDFELDSLCRQNLIARLRDGSNAESLLTCHRKILPVLVPKDWPTFRPAHLLSPNLDLASVAGAMWLGERMDRLRLPKESQTVFSYRLDETGRSWFDPSVGWSQYRQRSIDCAHQFGHVLTADISGFYSNIRPSHFAHKILRDETTADEDAVLNRLVYLLMNDIWGLPVGGDAARMMAELALIPLDVEMRGAGLKFVRFVDDYRFFVETTEAIEQVLYNATSILSNFGMQWNKSKIKIWRAADFIEWERFHGVLNVSDGESGVEVSNNHFDPYAELVYHRAAELRKELRVISLSGALNKELDKVRPSLSNVKVILATIPVSDRMEQEQCLELLAGSFCSPWMVQILPHIYRLLRKLDWLSSFNSRDSFCSGLESALLSSQATTPYEIAFLIHCYRRVSGGHITKRLVKAFHQIREQSQDVFLLREVVYSLLLHEPTQSEKYFEDWPFESSWLHSLQREWALSGKFNID